MPAFASSRLFLCRCSFENSSRPCSSSLSRCCCSSSLCINIRRLGVGGGDFFPLAISSSSALHLRILERGERVAAGVAEVAEVIAVAVAVGIAGRAATPAGFQLARGVEFE